MHEKYIYLGKSDFLTCLYKRKNLLVFVFFMLEGFMLEEQPNFSLKLTKPLIYSMINADIKIVGTL